VDVVFDVNILVSSLTSRGKPRQLRLRAVRGEFQLILSRRIVEEFVEVIGRPKFRRYLAERDVRDFLEVLSATAKIVRTRSRFRVIREDPEDNTIQAAAYDARPDYIVSGEKHLLGLKEFERARIVTVERMLDVLRSETG
jgi:putative PIN family toxin of toxin-antitoxin system